MADVAIKMGVDGPGNEVNCVLRIFEIIDESDAPEDSPFVFGQRDREKDEKERSRYVQRFAEELGLS